MDIASLMDRATADLHPSPSLLQAARTGGRRRLRRRRTSLALLTASAIGAVTVVATATVAPDRAAVRYDGTVFDGTTHGDLAGDTPYLAKVVDVWDHSHATSANHGRGIFDDLRGEPRVVWAGTTPAGPAAVVAQDSNLHEHDDIQLDHEGIHQLLGFVGPGANGAPALVADTYPAPGTEDDIAWYVDRARTVIAALDTSSKPLGVSWSWEYHRDGSVGRTYTPMVTHEGLGLLSLPKGLDGRGTVRVGLMPVTGYPDLRGVLGGAPSGDPDHRLGWFGGGGAVGHTQFRMTSGWSPTDEQLGQQLEGALDRKQSGGDAFSTGYTGWYAYGVLPDGRHVVAGERQLETDPSHVYAVIGAGADAVVVPGGAVDVQAVLPVAIHLPDGQGWLVAQNHALLDWRAGSGAWVAQGSGAALLPDTATAVQVTLPGSPPQVVQLSRS
jgi:hypothetical protein